MAQPVEIGVLPGLMGATAENELLSPIWGANSWAMSSKITADMIY